jgi:hypothetical protein
VEVGATLTNEDFTGFDNLTTESLHAQVLGVGIATVSRR